MLFFEKISGIATEPNGHESIGEVLMERCEEDGELKERELYDRVIERK